jgi:hypothetical protein
MHGQPGVQVIQDSHWVPLLEPEKQATTLLLNTLSVNMQSGNKKPKRTDEQTLQHQEPI